MAKESIKWGDADTPAPVIKWGEGDTPADDAGQPAAAVQAQPTRAGDAEIDQLAAAGMPASSAAAQLNAVPAPRRSSVLEGVQMPEPEFDPAQGERLSLRRNAEQVDIDAAQAGAPSMRATPAGPQVQATGDGMAGRAADLIKSQTLKTASGFGRHLATAADAVGAEDLAGNINARAAAASDKSKRLEQGVELERAARHLETVNGFAPGSIVQDGRRFADEYLPQILAQGQQVPMALFGGLTPMVGMSYLSSYADARDAGKSPAEALAYAVPQAAAEYVGEKVGGMGRLNAAFEKAVQTGFARDAAWRNLGKAFMAAGAKEVPSEELTYGLQFINDKFSPVGLQPNATWEDFKKGAADTAIVALGSGGMMAGAGAMVAGREPEETRRSAEQMARNKGFLVTDPQADDARLQRLRAAGEKEAADLLEKRLQLQRLPAEVERELGSMQFEAARTPEFQTYYRELRTAGVKPVEAAGRTAVVSDFRSAAAQAGMSEKAMAAALEASRKVDLANLPGFLHRFTQSLATRGVVQSVDVGPQLEAARDASMDAAMASIYEQDQQEAAGQAQAVQAIEAPAGQPTPEELNTGNDIILTPDAEAAHAAATSPLNDLPEPSQAQKDAGNYKVGRMRIAGMDISVENPQGSTRRGTDPDGQAWETPMRHHYGYFRGTTAADGDKLDVFVVPSTPEDYRGPVFVVDQIDPRTGRLDEHKVILGASNEAEAEAIYRSNYSADWQGLGAITRLPLPAFKAWAATGNKKEALGDIQTPQQTPQARQAATPLPADETTAAADGTAGVQPGAVQPDGAPAGRGATEQPAAVEAPDSAAQQRADFAAAEKARTAPGNRARSRAQEANHFKAFIAKHGISNALANEFAPGKKERQAALVQGYGPVFRKSGLQLDALAELAVQDGYLITPDVTRLASMISDVLRGKRIVPQYADGVAETEMELLAALEKEAGGEQNAEVDAETRAEREAIQALAALSDDSLQALAADETVLTAGNNVSEADFLRALGATEQEIRDATEGQSRKGQDTESRPGPQEAAAGAAPGSAESRDGQARDGAEGLTAPTREDITAQQDRAAQADDLDQREQVRRESEAGAGQFSLTQEDGRQDNTGDLFSQPAEPAPQKTIADMSPADLLRAAADKMDGKAEKIDDLGEKIGGARKDTAMSGGKRGSRKTEDDRPAWARRFEISQIVRAGGQIGDVQNEGRWVIRDTRSLDWRKMPKQVGRDTYASREAAEKAVPLLAVAQKHRAVPVNSGGTQAWEIWRDISDRKRVKVVDQQFSSRDDAMRYMAENATAIIEANTTFGEADLPVPEDKRRDGPQRRQGDVKGEDFMQAFGFRGVEFGNWNNQDERQQLMNEAYDGLMDLAEVMGIPPRAISLNGDLALAFGARGHGLSGARAHYEPDRAVMNLTKMKGAGALAHEWFHALDHYFGRQDGKAPVTWVTNLDGTRSLKTNADFENNAVTSGFSRKDSGVRQEVREAYLELMDTMMRRAEKYVEDTAKTERFVAAVRKDVEDRLTAIRRDLAEQKDPRYWKRNNKPATADQLAAFDAIAQQILEGTALETERRPSGTKSMTGMRWSNDHLENLSTIYKAVRGRSGFDADQNGTLDRLRQTMGLYSARLKMLAEAQTGEEKTKKVPTDFAMDAKSLDQGRGTDYWITPHEMAARAFQGYVEDKIGERGGKSPFLNYGPENFGILTPWGVKRPYPAGEERKAINAAFDKLVGVIQTKETDKGVAMFSRGDTGNLLPADDETEALVQQYGEPVSSIMDAERRMSNGERIFAMHEQDETLSQITSVKQLKAWTSEQLIALPNGIVGENFARDDRPYIINPTTVANVQAAITELLGGKQLAGGLGRIVATTSDEIKSKWEPLIGKNVQIGSEGEAGVAQAFFEPGTKTVFMIADHITTGTETAVLAHELMHKHGQAVLGESGWNRLHGMIGTWKNAPEDSDERFVYDYASRKVQAVGEELSTQELFPYAVEAAIRIGVKPSMAAKRGTVASWLESVRQHLKEVWGKITGKPETFKAQDLVDLAFGIAQMENPETAALRGALADQTDTPAFRKWFGDSKVVDDQGKPLVVYHGTPADVSAFDINAPRNMAAFKDAQGFYFTNEPRDASAYTEDRETGDPADGANIMPVYLRMENPLRVESGDTNSHPAYISAARRAKLEADGYDGIIYADGVEFVVFRPEQIKSAIGNRGTFDPENPDIRYTREAEDPEGKALRALSENDELFALPKSDKDTVEGIAADNDPGIKVRQTKIGNETLYVLTMRNGGTAKLWVRPANPYGDQIYSMELVDGDTSNVETGRPGENPEDVPADTEDVYLDVSNLKEGGQGNRLYNIAATFAHNTGRIFIGDPSGLSDVAMRRRLENMISTALKFGTTDHIAPHPRQVKGDAKLGVPPLKWVYGDSLGNIRRMIDVSLKSEETQGLPKYEYDPATGNLSAVETGGRPLAAKPGPAGGSVPDVSGAPEQRGRTGARAAIFRALLREEGGTAQGNARGRDGLLARLVSVGNQFPDSARKIFYSRSAAGTATGVAQPPAGTPPASGTAQESLFAPTVWGTPEPTRTDRIIYELQDGRVDLKRVQQAIEASGQKITEQWDARLAETLYPGRVAYRSKAFLDAEVKPLLKAMAMNNVGMAELADYLHARGAEERNVQIAKVNPDMPDGGAGRNSKGVLMTTQAARDYLAAVTPARKAVLDAMAKRVDAITAGTRKLLVDQGLEKQETIDAWEAAYKNYVPMFRDEAETALPPHPQGSGFTVKGSASRRATGSTKEVTNILAHVLMQREAAITRAEKNRVAMALYGMALTHPNPEFWTTIKPGMSNAQIAAELQAMGVDPMTARVGMEGVPTIRTVDDSTGKVIDRPNPLYRSLPGAIPLKVAGEDRVLMLNTDDERGARLAENLKNLDGLTRLDLAGSIVGKATRWLASVNTQYNPAFGLVNLTRDTLGGVINLGSTELRGRSLKILADTPFAIFGIARELATGKQTGEWGKLYRQFVADGGQTGYKELWRDPNDRARAIERELAAEGRLTPGKAAHAILDVLDGFNTTLENAVRLSAYKEALDKGMSRAEAARLGRELTVDFNRKGRAGREVGPLYAFFNASVQGAARTIQTLKGPTGAKIIVGGLSLGVLQAMMLAAAGYDDDDLPEFVKSRALIIPMPGDEKRYVAIPYPLGLHVIPNTGRVLTELVLNGGKHIGKRSVEAIGEIAAAFNPLGGGNIFTAHGALTTAAPTVVDPIIDMAANKNFAGGTIERETRGEADNRPGAARARESTQRSTTGQVYIGISKAINSMTGGTAYEAGAASPTPERVRYLAQTVGGGLLREIEKGINASTAAARGDKVKSSQIPVIGRFYGNVDDDQVQTGRYYRNADELRRLDSSFKAMDKAGDGAAMERLAKSNPELAMVPFLNEIQRSITELNKAAVLVIDDPKQMADIDAARTELMRGLNETVKEMEKAAGNTTLADRLKPAKKTEPAAVD